MKYRKTKAYKDAKSETAKLFLHGTIKTVVGVIGAIASFKLIRNGSYMQGGAVMSDNYIEALGDTETTEKENEEIIDAKLANDGEGS